MTATEHAAQFVRDVRLHGAALPEQFNEWLTKLPTVQYQALVSSLMALGTAVVYWICMLREIDIDLVALGSILAFIAAYGRITYANPFKVKRDSYKPEIQSEQNAQGKVTTTTKEAVSP